MENYVTAIKDQFKAFFLIFTKSGKYLLRTLWFHLMTLHHFIHNVRDTKVIKALVLIWKWSWFYVLLCRDFMDRLKASAYLL